MTGPHGRDRVCDCGHKGWLHTSSGRRPCSGHVHQYIAGNSGPGTSIPRPCPCTGYTPQEETMNAEPGSGQQDGGPQ